MHRDNKLVRLVSISIIAVFLSETPIFANPGFQPLRAPEQALLAPSSTAGRIRNREDEVREEFLRGLAGQIVEGLDFRTLDRYFTFGRDLAIILKKYLSSRESEVSPDLNIEGALAHLANRHGLSLEEQQRLVKELRLRTISKYAELAQRVLNIVGISTDMDYAMIKKKSEEYIAKSRDPYDARYIANVLAFLIIHGYKEARYLAEKMEGILAQIRSSGIASDQIRNMRNALQDLSRWWQIERKVAPYLSEEMKEMKDVLAYIEAAGLIDGHPKSKALSSLPSPSVEVRHLNLSALLAPNEQIKGAINRILGEDRSRFGDLLERAEIERIYAIEYHRRTKEPLSVVVQTIFKGWPFTDFLIVYDEGGRPWTVALSSRKVDKLGSWEFFFRLPAPYPEAILSKVERFLSMPGHKIERLERLTLTVPKDGRSVECHLEGAEYIVRREGDDYVFRENGPEGKDLRSSGGFVTIWGVRYSIEERPDGTLILIENPYIGLPMVFDSDSQEELQIMLSVSPLLRYLLFNNPTAFYNVDISHLLVVAHSSTMRVACFYSEYNSLVGNAFFYRYERRNRMRHFAHEYAHHLYRNKLREEERYQIQKYFRLNHPDFIEEGLKKHPRYKDGDEYYLLEESFTYYLSTLLAMEEVVFQVSIRSGEEVGIFKTFEVSLEDARFFARLDDLNLFPQWADPDRLSALYRGGTPYETMGEYYEDVRRYAREHPGENGETDFLLFQADSELKALQEFISREELRDAPYDALYNLRNHLNSHRGAYRQMDVVVELFSEINRLKSVTRRAIEVKTMRRMERLHEKTMQLYSEIVDIEPVAEAQALQTNL